MSNIVHFCLRTGGGVPAFVIRHPPGVANCLVGGSLAHAAGRHRPTAKSTGHEKLTQQTLQTEIVVIKYNWAHIEPDCTDFQTK